MDSADLTQMANKKVRAVAYQELPWQSTLMIVTSYGKTFYFTSTAPIQLEVETEQ